MGHHNYRRYTAEEKRRATELYFANGHSIDGVIKELGYPTRSGLSNWLKETTGYIPKKQVRYSHQIKAEALRLTEEESRTQMEVARMLNIGQAATISLWRSKARKGGMEVLMTDDGIVPTPVEGSSEDYGDDVDALKKKLHQTELENDILRGTIDLLKKDPGLSAEAMSNKEKTILANALRPRYPLKEIIAFLKISKSSYEYQACALKRADKYADLRIKVREIFEENDAARGYRFIWAELRKLAEPVYVSEKVIRRIMVADGMFVPYAKKKRHYSSYKGEISEAPENLLKRDFSAAAPNVKWLTDITEFKVGAAKCYLSPVVDCFDGMVVAWTASTHPNAQLVNTMLEDAATTLGEEDAPVLHSDRGCHYRWPGWIALTEKHGITRSMSKIGCSPDNSACEGFFGRLKNEFYYYRDWTGVTTEEFIERLGNYIRRYNEKRTKKSLGWLSPLEYRNSLGLAA